MSHSVLWSRGELCADPKQSLRHIFHHGTHEYPTLHRRLDVSDTASVLTLEGGKGCWVEKIEGEESLKREASLWVLPEKNLSPNVVMMTRAFQEATSFKIGDQVRISLTEESIADAEEVVVKDISDAPPEDATKYKHPPKWESNLSMSFGAF